MLKNIDNQIPIEFNQATSSKITTPTTKSTTSIIEKGSYKDKKCDQIGINHLMKENTIFRAYSKIIKLTI